MSQLTDFMEGKLRAGFFRTNAWTQRANSTAYAVGDLVYLATFDATVYECITAGTSAASPPTFNTNLGDTTTDGTVVWLATKLGPVKRPIFIGLYTAAPGETGGGTEVSGGGYARVQVAPADANWTATLSTDGKAGNAANVTFPAPTANWGVVTNFGQHDRATGGNLTWYGTLAVQKTINNGDPAPFFGVGDLSFEFQ
jgi:hypothetical protein